MSINASTLPSNFLTQTTARMRLMQPEPQYFFAQAAMAGRLSTAAIKAGATTVQQYVSMRGGGAAVPQELDRLVRFADAGFGKIVQTIEGFGKEKGDNIKFKRPVFNTGGFSEEAREVTPNKPTSTDGLVITEEIVTAVLKQFEGPYAANGSAVQPYTIAEFDAKWKNAAFELVGEVSLRLMQDYVKWLDTVIRNRFRASKYASLPTGISAASGFSSGGTDGVSLELIANARKAISDREWKPFSNGRYVCLVPTSFNVQMIADPDWARLSANQREKNILISQLASWQDVDFFEVTTLKSYAATESVNVGGTSTAVASGVTLDEALIIGPEAVGFGTAQDPETFFADDTDYGKYAKVIWRALHAFQTLDERGIQRIVYQRTT